MVFEVGDIVRVREWNDMVAEFGLKDDGGRNPTQFIPIEPYIFSAPMKNLCGRVCTVEGVYQIKKDLYRVYVSGLPGSWAYSDQMFEYTSNFSENEWIDLMGVV